MQFDVPRARYFTESLLRLLYDYINIWWFPIFDSFHYLIIVHHVLLVQCTCFLSLPVELSLLVSVIASIFILISNLVIKLPFYHLPLCNMWALTWHMPRSAYIKPSSRAPASSFCGHFVVIWVFMALLFCCMYCS